MKIFLLIGQSNMAGPKITPWEECDDKRLEGVLLSNDQDKWIPAKNPINGYSTIRWQPTPGLSPAPTFAEMIKKAYKDEEIGLISNARGSSKIIEWQKGERYFTEAVRRVKDTVGDKKIDGILWLQGEQDVVDKADYENYAPRFKQFIFDIRSALGGQDIPFIAGEIWGDVEFAEEKYHEGIREVNRQIEEVILSTENCALISTKGAEHTECDPVHFAKEGMRKIGYRYAEKYLEIWGK